MKISGNRLIWSVRDLTEILKQNNTNLDSYTLVYVYDEATY